MAYSEDKPKNPDLEIKRKKTFKEIVLDILTKDFGKEKAERILALVPLVEQLYSKSKIKHSA
jgi:hypothetical protein